jgi:hypothetical protein
VIVVGTLVLASVAGQRAYTSENSLAGFTTRHPGGGSSTFAAKSGAIVTTFNFTVSRPSSPNGSTLSLGLGFVVWRATGMSLDYVNLTFSAPAPGQSIRLDGPNYYAGGYPPIQTTFTNISATGPGQISGEVLTMRGFPQQQNPTASFGVGIFFSAGTTENDTGATILSVTVGLSASSGMPFVWEGYSGTTAFNLDDL